MPDDTQQSRPESSEHALAAGLAGYLRSSFTYPANNRRVIEQRARCIEAIAHHAGQAELLLDESAMWLGAQQLPLEEPGLAWLRETLFRCATGSIRFEPTLTGEQLQGFADRVRRAFAARPKHFEEFWREPLPGIRVGPPEALVQLRSSQHEEGEASDESTRGLRALLEQDQELIARLDDLHDEFADMRGSSHRTTRIDILELIQDALPAEAHVDGELARTLARGVLEACHGKIGSVQDAAQVPGLEKIDEQMVKVGLQIFRAHVTELSEVSDEELPEGRPGDERITDDLGAMLREYESLPRPVGAALGANLDPLPEELLGIYLHGLRSGPAAETKLRSKQKLATLSSENPGVVRRLASYADRCFDASAPGVFDWRVLELVLASGHAHEAALPDWRDLDTLESAFPHLFGLLLDETARGTGGSRERLESLLEILGTERILAESEPLFQEQGITDEQRFATISATKTPAALPLYWVRLEKTAHSERGPLLRDLAERPLPPASTAALRVLHAEELSEEYLETLCCRADEPDAASELSSALIRGLLLHLLEEGIDQQRQVIATRLLQHHECEDNLALAQKIAQASSELPGRPEKALRGVAFETAETLSTAIRQRRPR